MTKKRPQKKRSSKPTQSEKSKGVGKRTSEKNTETFDGEVLLKQLFEVYKAWKALPTIWRGMTNKKLSELGIEDPVVIELLSVKNQSAFAYKYKVHIDTLTDWNKRIMETEGDFLDETRKWARRFTKNVVAAHYKKVVKRFDPMSGELWYKVIEGFSEKRMVEHSGKLSLVDLAKEVEDEENEKRRKQNSVSKDTT